MIPQPSSASGAAYWRSLEELAQTPEFREALKQEFAGYDPDEIASMSRRGFLQIMAASLSLAGVTLAGCRRLPEEKIAPFANRPENYVPGEPSYYASMFEQAGVAYGTLINAFDGRPTKVEGNPLHPFSLGATDIFGQASVLEMYDPERARWVYHRGQGQPAREEWNAFAAAIRARLGQGDAGRIAVLTGYSSSPSFDRLKTKFQEAHPQAAWYTWEPVNRDLEIQGTRAAFGQDLRPQYDFAKADVVACFDADPIGLHPGNLRYARQWSDRRRAADQPDATMNRLYVVESSFTTTGGVADERLPVRRAAVPVILAALAAELGVASARRPEALPEPGVIDPQRFITALADDLRSARGRSIITVGPSQPPSVHALAWAINQHLGNLGEQGVITFTPEPLPGTCLQDITALSRRLAAGEIDTLIILGGNPAYDAPADLDFPAKLQQAGEVIYLSQYTTETSAYATWNLPKAHQLESWGDGRAWDGTYTLQQPLIEPMYDGKTPAELLAILLDDEVQDGYGIVRETFRQLGYAGAGADGFERPWRQALHDGLVPDSGFDTVSATVKANIAGSLQLPGAADGFELTFHPSRNVYDGRFANNAWLQELPEAFTKVTWDNVALINIADARRLGIEQGQLLRVSVGDRELRLPAYLMPGQARGSIAVWLGYGREAVAPNTLNIGSGVGFNTYRLRTTERFWQSPQVGLKRAGEDYDLALTQNHHLLDAVGQDMTADRAGRLDAAKTEAGKGAGNYSGRIVKDATVDYYRKNPKFVLKGDHFGAIPLQLWEPPKRGPGGEEWPEPEGGWDRQGAPAAFNAPHAWGMSVDMNTCIGCNACVVACQAENNIPVVGKQQVRMSREMHWIRTDRYFKTDPTADPHAEAPQIAHMPVMCQHCENAPCEQVCPVAATVHDTEGLNTMVYNRCIGTRYCSNNCPYKVRRFNYFDYHSKPPAPPIAAVPGIQAKPWLDFPDTQQRKSVNEIKRMMFNPDVTVRMRGVMEKCTYCTQRIARSKIAAKVDHARTISGDTVGGQQRDSYLVRDGEIQTACQQSCPTQAITFGDLNDMDAKVAQEQMNPRSYGVLTELNTRPRTKYLAKIRNPKTERYEM